MLEEILQKSILLVYPGEKKDTRPTYNPIVEGLYESSCVEGPGINKMPVFKLTNIDKGAQKSFLRSLLQKNIFGKLRKSTYTNHPICQQNRLFSVVFFRKGETAKTAPPILSRLYQAGFEGGICGQTLAVLARFS